MEDATTKQKERDVSPTTKLTLQLTEDLADMNFESENEDHVSHKRTIEGSPMVRSSPNKRIDLNKTPHHLALSSQEASQRLFDDVPQKRLFVDSILVIPQREETIERTVLVIDSNCNDHNTGEHQENALRTELIGKALRRPSLKHHICWSDESERRTASLADLLRVHDYEYLRHIEEKCHGTLNVLPQFYAPNDKLDADTPLVPSSLDAARRFCGAAIAAVDEVMTFPLRHVTPKSVPTVSISPPSIASDSVVSERSEEKQEGSRVFVIGRPPGHHAGPSGAVVSSHYWQRPDMASSGFCLLNTVAVAAAYARYKYGHPSSASSSFRVAIVDIDVHHGNGTEEIIRNLRPHTQHLPLPSSWAPIGRMSYKPWLNEDDPNCALFSSIHLFADEKFYPCSGGEGEIQAEGDNIINISLTPIGPGPWDQRLRRRLTTAQRKELTALASKELRAKVEAVLLPRLRAFRPDLLIISAGFDAHYDDMYHFLDEEDFYWLTKVLCDCSGRVVSILEGGYSLHGGGGNTKVAEPHGEQEEKLANAPSVQGTLPSRPGRGRNKKYDTTGAVTTGLPDCKFAQESGDGGLVKGVLAHVAALAGVKAWC